MKGFLYRGLAGGGVVQFEHRARHLGLEAPVQRLNAGDAGGLVVGRHRPVHRQRRRQMFLLPGQFCPTNRVLQQQQQQQTQRRPSLRLG